LELQNQILMSRLIKWEAGPKIQYLHLCTDYPSKFNKKGLHTKGELKLYDYDLFESDDSMHRKKSRR